METYRLPDKLDAEISQLEELIAKFRKGEISSVELKSHRVPFGVYEQREPDTYMVRIRCAAGIITPAQLKDVAGIASSYGVDSLHITTRQELQIHYVKLDNLIPVIRALKDAGLATRGGGGNTVRNVMAQEDAGIDPREAFDVTPYAVELTSRLIAEDDSWTLPRKFKIAFSSSADDKGFAAIADVGFIARLEHGKKGFKVYAAGGLGSKAQIGNLLFDFIDANEVYRVAKAVKNLFWKYGNRRNKHAARLRFLWRSLGQEEFIRRFQEEYAAVKNAGFAPLGISDSENEYAGAGTAAACGGGQPLELSLPAESPADADDFALWKKRFVKEQKQCGLFSILIPVDLGFIPAARAMELAQFLRPFGADVLRMTKDQNFLARNIPAGHLANLYNFLMSRRICVNLPAIYGAFSSCAGASTCQLGICLSRQAAAAAMRALQKSGLDPDNLGDVRLNISGCPNSCGQHQAADLGFFGRAGRRNSRLYPAYSVVAGAVIADGKTRFAEAVGEISARDLPSLIKDIFQAYIARRGTVHHAPAQDINFRDYIRVEGKEDLRQFLVRYKDIPLFEEDKNYYFDWGAEKEFSLDDRRGGECSAGLFDLIEADLNNIRETRRILAGTVREPPPPAGGRNNLLADLLFYTTRMLLITRGIEPKNARESYAAFREHFIATGFVDSSFESLLAEAGDGTVAPEKENQVNELVERVEFLYANMDNAFNFKIPAGPAAASAAVKDLRGVACPMNFVKTKIELSRLTQGDILEIWLDDGAPIENVPGSVRAEGHQILEQKRVENHWVVVIQKK